MLLRWMVWVGATNWDQAERMGTVKEIYISCRQTEASLSVRCALIGAGDVGRFVMGLVVGRLFFYSLTQEHVHYVVQFIFEATLLTEQKRQQKSITQSIIRIE